MPGRRQPGGPEHVVTPQFLETCLRTHLRSCMPYLQLGESQFPLRVGEMGVGSAPGAAIRLPGTGQGLEALLQTSAEGAVSIRRARPDALVRVNGVQLGMEPAPLLHGDKLEIGGHELFFGDERRAGGTHFITERAHGSTEARVSHGTPTAASGGRLISLVDGREYPVPREGLSLGRDPGCDVVIPASESSRRHARITAGADGYEVHDTSTNGVFVNGMRIERVRLLGRGDVIRIATEEFRFYADVPPPELPGVEPAEPPEIAPEVAATLAASTPPPVRTPEAHVAAPEPAPPAMPGSDRTAPSDRAREEPRTSPLSRAARTDAPAQRDRLTSPETPPPSRQPPPAPADAPTREPAAPAAAAAEAAELRPVLATLEILNEGVRKGTRFEVRTPLAHIGRGAHNDIVLHDESVSETHAKLQRREGGWTLVDLNSTNGTYVAGRRVHGDQSIEGALDLRFGGVKMAFRATSDAPSSAGGTRAITGVSVDQIRRVENSPHTLQSRGGSSGSGDVARLRERDTGTAGAEEDESKRAGGVPLFIWILALALGALALIFVWQGRS